jgi:hypothetical protein
LNEDCLVYRCTIDTVKISHMTIPRKMGVNWRDRSTSMRRGMGTRALRSRGSFRHFSDSGSSSSCSTLSTSTPTRLLLLPYHSRPRSQGRSPAQAHTDNKCPYSRARSVILYSATYLVALLIPAAQMAYARKKYPNVAQFAQDVELRVVFSNETQFDEDHTPLWETARLALPAQGAYPILILSSPH